MMTREELETQAKALGVPFNSRTSDAKLVERVNIALGEAEAPEAPDEPAEAPESAVMVRVLMRNLWTTQGKYFAGDDVALPRDEAERLQAEDKVVIK